MAASPVSLTLNLGKSDFQSLPKNLLILWLRSRELIPEGQTGGLVIFGDQPNYWDAWGMFLLALCTQI